MSNKKDFATSTVLTAPSTPTGGTSLVVQSGHGARFPSAPFYVVAHPPSEFPTLDNAEKLLVTNKSTDTFTITRAQGDTTAKSIEAGWRISNAVFLADFPATFDDLADGSTNKAYTGTEKTKLSGIETAADVTDAGNVGSSIHGSSAKTTPVDADTVAMIDSAASNVLKKISFSNIWAYILAKIQAITSLSGHSWFLDEDDMASDSATKTASQQSIKAYVDKPAAFAAYLSSNQSVSSTNVKGAFNTEDFDNANAFNTSTNRFTAPYTGLYYFHIQLSLNNAGTSARAVTLLRKNGTTDYSGTQNTDSYTSGNSAYIIPLTAGDYVEAWIGSNPASTTAAGGALATRFTGFCIAKA